MDKQEGGTEDSTNVEPKSNEISEHVVEKVPSTDAQPQPQPRRWFPGKYIGISKKTPSEQSPEHDGGEHRESISSERPSETERRSSFSSTGKSGWYPGKYMGMRDRRKSNASETDPVDIMDTGEEPASGQTTWSTFGGDPEDSKSKRRTSTWLSSFSRQDADSLRDEIPHGGDDSAQQRAHSTGGYYSNWFRRNPGNESKQDVAPAEDTEADKEEQKKEAMITRTVRCIRNKFIDRQLHGRILIYRTSGVVTTAVLCEVNAMEIKSAEVTAEEIANLSYNDRRAITMTDTVLNSLERRSRAWDGCDFAQEVFLTRGMFIGVSDPFVGMIGFSIQVDFTCTIKSLLASRKRFEAKVKAEKELAALMNGDERGSFFSRSFSFSSTASGSDKQHPPHQAFVNQPIVPVVKSAEGERGVHLSDDEADEQGGVKEV